MTEKTWRAPRPVHTPDALAVAWVAGLVEGEGCFLAHSGRYFSARFQLSMCDHDVVTRAWEEMGSVGKLTIKKPGPRSIKDQLRWSIAKQAEVSWFMDLMYPHMGMRRRNKIEELREQMAGWAS